MNTKQRIFDLEGVVHCMQGRQGELGRKILELKDSIAGIELELSHLHPEPDDQGGEISNYYETILEKACLDLDISQEGTRGLVTLKLIVNECIKLRQQIDLHIKEKGVYTAARLHFIAKIAELKALLGKAAPFIRKPRGADPGLADAMESAARADIEPKNTVKGIISKPN